MLLYSFSETTIDEQPLSSMSAAGTKNGESRLSRRRAGAPHPNPIDKAGAIRPYIFTKSSASR